MRAALLLPLFLSAAASAQDAVALHPADHTLPRDQPLRLNAVTASGDDWKAAPFPASVEWLFVRVAGTQSNRDQATLPAPDPDGSIALGPLPSGAALVGLDLSEHHAAWSPEAVAAFAARAGRVDVCPERDTPVRHLRSAATLVASQGDAAAPDPADTAPTSKAGLRAELRPLMDPTLLATPTDLPVRIYIEGEAVPSVRVTAEHVDTGTNTTVTSDAKGIAPVHLDRPGRWRLTFVAIRDATEPGQPLIAASGTLTFEVSAPPPAPASKEAER